MSEFKKYWEALSKEPEFSAFEKVESLDSLKRQLEKIKQQLSKDLEKRAKLRKKDELFWTSHDEIEYEILGQSIDEEQDDIRDLKHDIDHYKSFSAPPKYKVGEILHISEGYSANTDKVKVLKVHDDKTYLVQTINNRGQELKTRFSSVDEKDLKRV